MDRNIYLCCATGSVCKEASAGQNTHLCCATRSVCKVSAGQNVCVV